MQVTSNFIRHLKIKHPAEFQKFELMKSAKHRPTKSKQEKFQELTIRLIANNMLPMSIVEDESFKNLIRFANPTLQVMSRPTAMKVLDETYLTMTEHLRNIISENKYFCTTADVWSTKHKSFFGYTCHWLDESFGRNSMVLACKRFSGSHTYDRISDFILKIHAKFGLNCNNVVATVTDNGSNFLKAFREFGITKSYVCGNIEDSETADSDEIDEIEFKNERFENSLPKHIKCATHTLNLLASTDFNRILEQNNSNLKKHKHVSIYVLFDTPRLIIISINL